MTGDEGKDWSLFFVRKHRGIEGNELYSALGRSYGKFSANARLAVSRWAELMVSQASEARPWLTARARMGLLFFRSWLPISRDASRVARGRAAGFPRARASPRGARRRKRLRAFMKAASRITRDRTIAFHWPSASDS